MVLNMIILVSLQVLAKIVESYKLIEHKWNSELVPYVLVGLPKGPYIPRYLTGGILPGLQQPKFDFRPHQNLRKGIASCRYYASQIYCLYYYDYYMHFYLLL